MDEDRRTNGVAAVHLLKQQARKAWRDEDDHIACGRAAQFLLELLEGLKRPPKPAKKRTDEGAQTK